MNILWLRYGRNADSKDTLHATEMQNMCTQMEFMTNKCMMFSMGQGKHPPITSTTYCAIVTPYTILSCLAQLLYSKLANRLPLIAVLNPRYLEMLSKAGMLCCHQELASFSFASRPLKRWWRGTLKTKAGLPSVRFLLIFSFGST